MTTPTPLADWQYELGGVLLGPGTPVQLRAVEGLTMPTLRTADVEPDGEDGLWLGADHYAGRTIRMDAAVKAPADPGAVLDQLADLQAAASSLAVRGQGGTTMDLRIKLPGRPVRVMRGRLRKLEPDLAQLVHGWVPVDIEFQAADALFYTDAQATTSMPLGILTHGGFTAPIRPPFHIDADPLAVGRPSLVEVEGTAPTWPVLRVTVPCANPTITHVTSGRSLTVQVSLTAGEWVAIDTRPGWRSVLRDNGGSAPLAGQSRLDQFQLSPGLNEFRWTATDPTLTSTLAVTWWPAYQAL